MSALRPSSKVHATVPCRFEGLHMKAYTSLADRPAVPNESHAQWPATAALTMMTQAGMISNSSKKVELSSWTLSRDTS